jgi:hypothetical protein
MVFFVNIFDKLKGEIMKRFYCFYKKMGRRRLKKLIFNEIDGYSDNGVEII